MPNACRHNLRQVAGHGQFANPGLALQRYLTDNGDNHGAAKALLERVQASPAPQVYKTAFQRYKAALPNPLQIELTLGGPMALGLGMSSPLEVGLTTLHTYGMPYIPGSAIKGVCRDVAEALRTEGHVGAEQFLTLIGDQKNAGMCVFYDAWYIPEGDCKPFHRDVVTVHHPAYYQQKGAAWPTDFDDPNPVPFIVVKPGARFLFAVKLPSPEWEGFVTKLLVHAMTTHGVGGKTNAGYGWFEAPAGHGTVREQENQGAEPRTPEQVWPACAGEKKPDKRGGFSITLKHANERVMLTQSEWTKLTSRWSTEVRRAVEQGSKTVRATIKDVNGKKTVMAIEPEG
jgi:CRISPR-associated protein Cmr6